MLLSHHGILKTVAGGVPWVPIDADILLNVTKNSPILYTKNGGGIFNCYFFRNHGVVTGKKVRMKNSVWSNDFIGFYNPTLTNTRRYNNFDYCLQATNGGTNQVLERGIAKWSSVGLTGDETLEVEKITGSCKYYTDGILKYTSLQNFNTGFYGGVTFNIGDTINNCEIVA